MTTFLVVAHEEPQVFGRLMQRLAGFPTYVHVDRRRSLAPFLAAARGLDHVEFMATRRRVQWGGFSVVGAMMELMAAALAAPGSDGHIVLLSGTCYPLRPVAEIAADLADHPDTDFIRFVDARANPTIVRHLTTGHYRDTVRLPAAVPASTRAERRLIHWVEAVAPRRRYPLPEMPVAYGHAHWALTSQTARVVLASRTPEVDEVFRRVASPDEKYVHTLIANSQRCANTVDGGFALTSCGCVRRLSATHELRGGRSGVWGLEDLDVLRESGAWFARKFGGPGALAVLDALDRVAVAAS